MNFPRIKTIDDVLPHIKDNDNFVVNKKDDYFVIDYILNTPETFNNSYEKECRGIVFDEDGHIMARRLHKFFNVNEREESRVENIDFSKPHVILEKLDGSMITPMVSHGKMTWGSKAGITFLTPQIEEFVKKHPRYQDFADECFMYHLTPIFEWCSNKNRIVISHPEDRLVLIAVRGNEYGDYAPYEVLQYYGKYYSIDVVNAYPGTVESMERLIEITKPLEGTEGFVVRFDDGKMVKVKADQYCLFHKSKDELMHEKNVVAILVDGKADDFRVLLSENDRKKFEEFESRFWHYIYANATNFFLSWALCNHKNMTRKEYALDASVKYQHSSFLKSIIFKFFEQNKIYTKDIREEIVNIIKKNTGSQTNIDKVRELWNGAKWVY